jgi:hypothetical protein
MKDKNDTMLPDCDVRENVIYRLALAETNIEYYRAKLDNVGIDGAAFDLMQAAIHLNEEQLKRAMLTAILYGRP